MSADLILRTIGTIICMYAVGFLVTAMSIASLETAGYSLTGPMCAPSECRAVAVHHPPNFPIGEDPSVIGAAALMASGF